MHVWLIPKSLRFLKMAGSFKRLLRHHLGNGSKTNRKEVEYEEYDTLFSVWSQKEARTRGAGGNQGRTEKGIQREVCFAGTIQKRQSQAQGEVMNTADMLGTLRDYYAVNRHVGHTPAMLDGAKHSDCLVLWPNRGMAQHYRNDLPLSRVVSLGNLNVLRGQNKALVIDNAAMYSILSDALSEIGRLNAELARAMMPPTIPKAHIPKRQDKVRRKSDGKILSVVKRSRKHNEICVVGHFPTWTLHGTINTAYHLWQPADRFESVKKVRKKRAGGGIGETQQT